MESNNLNLGNDVTEDITSNTEQTIADVQEAAEYPVEEPLQAELTDETLPQSEDEGAVLDASAGEVEELANVEDVMAFDAVDAVDAVDDADFGKVL